MFRYHQLLYIFSFLTIVGLGACTKYLDKKPDNLLGDDQLWLTRANAEGYLANVYSYRQAGGDYANIGASDEISCGFPGVPVRNMVGGNWSANDWIYYNWGGYYAGIRKSYIFEQNIDKVPSEQLSDELKQQYKSEAIFLRGYFYWMLLRQYGPFVKVTGVLSQDDDYHKYPRIPFDDCVAYINEIMDKAAPGLPYVWSSSNNNGRVTRGACYAVKALVAFWAANPLWNGNSRFANFKNPDGTALAPATYDQNKWKIAAERSKAIIDSGHYKLFTNLDNGGTSFDPYLSVRDLFLTSWNNEIIMGSMNWNWWSWVICSSPGPAGYNMYNATQNLVDAFRMKDGKEISDATSNYQETGFVSQNGANYWEQQKGDWSMYANREPRFYSNICYNGRPVIPAVTLDDKNYYSSDGNIDGHGRQEFYFTGKSGQKTMNNKDLTGYLPAKYISPDDNLRAMGAGSYRCPYILIRYAEIILNYVEALNEYDPGNPDIVTYLNMIRQRGGLPGIETVYPDAVGNKDKMRAQIIRERQVEMCFEGDRFYTLIRRQELGKPENQTIYGMNVYSNDNGVGFGYADFYKRTVFQKRFWNDRMYLFPIQQQDIERDRSLVQNPGW
ncbi:RagB/SusD family nutrient uptake outer membrane protein [Chitinophaga silvatica]|uniref:RagB/SusD family nutrient uptake outer membrane protein n=1 Tax=Chitinophaga silvatica TaxID=2282649 RepID=A0A3E1Y4S6_9BACT|nr:RagB/SusD family nutrient uptake outer membrane protein [Chitinophaga silvatica]RFS19646.1 RagB/SusD family nutrient uptake outer membrane protein [Chitinophaga silvatica]